MQNEKKFLVAELMAFIVSFIALWFFFDHYYLGSPTLASGPLGNYTVIGALICLCGIISKKRTFFVSLAFFLSITALLNHILFFSHFIIIDGNITIFDQRFESYWPLTLIGKTYNQLAITSLAAVVLICTWVVLGRWYRTKELVRKVFAFTALFIIVYTLEANAHLLTYSHKNTDEATLQENRESIIANHGFYVPIYDSFKQKKS